MLTRRWALSSMNSSCIWPRSAALPWEYKIVNLAKGCLQKVATILLPPLVSSKWTSTFLSAVSPENTSLPSSSLITSYVGGSGGKNANFAATFDVTLPIKANPVQHSTQTPHNQWGFRPSMIFSCVFSEKIIIPGKREDFILFYLFLFFLIEKKIKKKGWRYAVAEAIQEYKWRQRKLKWKRGLVAEIGSDLSGWAGTAGDKQKSPCPPPFPLIFFIYIYINF